MEKSLINPIDYHLSVKLQNGNGEQTTFVADDIEMIAYERSMSYTTLKDLIPTSSPSTASPGSSRMDSWREIPIKDPLVQHAAWAYLQPVEVAPNEKEGWWTVVKERCFGMFGCLNDVMLMVFNGWFSEQGGDEDKVE